jgi:hypothetical protein
MSNEHRNSSKRDDSHTEPRSPHTLYDVDRLSTQPTQTHSSDHSSSTLVPPSKRDHDYRPLVRVTKDRSCLAASEAFADDCRKRSNLQRRCRCEAIDPEAINKRWYETQLHAKKRLRCEICGVLLHLSKVAAASWMEQYRRGKDGQTIIRHEQYPLVVNLDRVDAGSRLFPYLWPNAETDRSTVQKSVTCRRDYSSRLERDRDEERQPQSSDSEKDDDEDLDVRDRDVDDGVNFAFIHSFCNMYLKGGFDTLRKYEVYLERCRYDLSWWNDPNDWTIDPRHVRDVDNWTFYLPSLDAEIQAMIVDVAKWSYHPLDETNTNQMLTCEWCDQEKSLAAFSCGRRGSLDLDEVLTVDDHLSEVGTTGRVCMECQFQEKSNLSKTEACRRMAVDNSFMSDVFAMNTLWQFMGRSIPGLQPFDREWTKDMAWKRSKNKKVSVACVIETCLKSAGAIRPESDHMRCGCGLWTILIHA